MVKKNYFIKMLYALMIGTLVIGLSVFNAEAAEVFIDSLNAGSTHLVELTWAGAPINGTSNQASSAAIGGDRDLVLNVTAGTSGNKSSIKAETTNVVLSLAQAPGMRSIAKVQWDGADTSSTLDCTTGFTATDLTGGGTNNGVAVRVSFNNSSTSQIRLRLYTNCTNWAVASLSAPTVASGEIVDMFFPFSSFGPGAGTLNTASIKAIELEMDASAVGSAGSDMEILYIKSTTMREYGDLPASFGTGYDDYHTPQGMRLGGNVDGEPTAGNAGAPADGDDVDFSPDDEDGVWRTYSQRWIVGGGNVDINFITAGCGAGALRCRVNAWVDWNGDGAFTEPGEQIMDDVLYNSGTQTLNLALGAGYNTGDDLYVRFRVCAADNVCDDMGETAVVNGEVEDYYWVFLPTALELVQLSGVSVPAPISSTFLFGAALLAMMALGLFLGVRYQRR